MSQPATQSRKETGSQSQHLNQPPLSPSEDLLEYAKEYAREKPEMVALWALGIGFVLGWKLKPW